MTCYPHRFSFTSTKDTFTIIGRNFSSGESDEFSVWWRKFRPTKFRPIRYVLLLYHCCLWISIINSIKTWLTFGTAVHILAARILPSHMATISVLPGISVRTESSSSFLWLTKAFFAAASSLSTKMITVSFLVSTFVPTVFAQIFCLDNYFKEGDTRF